MQEECSVLYQVILTVAFQLDSATSFLEIISREAPEETEGLKDFAQTLKARGAVTNVWLHCAGHWTDMDTCLFQGARRCGNTSSVPGIAMDSRTQTELVVFVISSHSFCSSVMVHAPYC